MGQFSDIDFSDSGNDDLNYLDHLAKEDTNMLGILILKRPSFFMKAFTSYVVYNTGNQKQTNYEKQHHHSNRKHNVQHEKH